MRLRQQRCRSVCRNRIRAPAGELFRSDCSGEIITMAESVWHGFIQLPPEAEEDEDEVEESKVKTDVPILLFFFLFVVFGTINWPGIRTVAIKVKQRPRFTSFHLVSAGFIGIRLLFHDPAPSLPGPTPIPHSIPSDFNLYFIFISVF